MKANSIKSPWKKALVFSITFFCLAAWLVPAMATEFPYRKDFPGIPTIDIIQYDPDNQRGFGDFWHTHEDDMGIIDPRTLGAVGETLMAVLRAED